MGNRKRYVMRQEEVEVLASSIITYGSKETYNKMKAKSIFEMENRKDFDQIIMDMSEHILECGRKEANNTGEDNQLAINIYYTLHYLLRKLAHEIHKKYKLSGVKKKDNRFLEVIRCETAPQII